MPAPVRVAITGAAGQIGYSLLFRVASGEMLGPNQPVILQLLEITPALDALRGVAMELEDCAFPLLEEVVQTDDPNTAFGDANYALLVGSVPRKAGMERVRSADDQRQHLHRSGQGAVRERRRRHQDPRRRQPGQHELPHRHEQLAEDRPVSVYGDDAARPQPRRRSACEQARCARHRRQEDDDLGQSLGHAVSRPLPLRGRRQERCRARERPGVDRERLHPDRRRSAVRRSSRLAVCRARPRPPTPRSTTCATGPSAPTRTTG